MLVVVLLLLLYVDVPEPVATGLRLPAIPSDVVLLKLLLVPATDLRPPKALAPPAEAIRLFSIVRRGP